MVRLLVGHVLERLGELPSWCVQSVVTSPPYFGLRDYGIAEQVWPDGWRGSLGQEPTVELYLEHLVEVCRGIRRVLRVDGTFWLNVGDSYASGSGGDRRLGDWTNPRAGRAAAWVARGRAPEKSLKPKDLMLIPSRLAIRLQDDGWWVRSEIVWAKNAPMPESVADRPTCAHEKVFLLTRSARYFYDAEAVKEDSIDPESLNGRNRRDQDAATRSDSDGYFRYRAGFSKIEIGRVFAKRNLRNVWRLPPAPFPGAHFATFPPELPRRCILAGTSAKGVCPGCGAPWARMIKISGGISRERDLTPKPGWRDDPAAINETIGWRPTCRCNAGAPIPATVLDPFLGAGTTALVADQLQRNCIGIELNPEYAAMAERRIREDNSLFAEIAAE